MSRPRWRSKAVDLVLLGTAGSLASLLGGCSGSGPSTTYSNDYHRNVYASAADCARDYGAAVCAAKGTERFSQYLGPTYRVVSGIPAPCHSSDPGPGRLAAASPRTSVERGGFGPSCSRRSTRRSWSTSSWGG
ncbi:MAG: hypothetical protein AB7O57_10805 [Hyphomicrobiaceae bacterium]